MALRFVEGQVAIREVVSHRSEVGAAWCRQRRGFGRRRQRRHAARPKRSRWLRAYGWVGARLEHRLCHHDVVDCHITVRFIASDTGEAHAHGVERQEHARFLPELALVARLGPPAVLVPHAVLAHGVHAKCAHVVDTVLVTPHVVPEREVDVESRLGQARRLHRKDLRRIIRLRGLNVHVVAIAATGSMVTPFRSGPVREGGASVTSPSPVRERETTQCHVRVVTIPVDAVVEVARERKH
mmetsp:Transcript_23360/g.62768  ORF Transcript_23360/g.62768 Transcript_23360/m.62768 type:complete len:240 (-) Transcript_23360:430-1149(-)